MIEVHGKDRNIVDDHAKRVFEKYVVSIRLTIDVAYDLITTPRYLKNCIQVSIRTSHVKLIYKNNTNNY